MPIASEYEQTDMFEDPREGDLVQVSPGRFIAKGGKPPEQIVAEVFHHADGTFGIRPVKGGRHVRMSDRTARLLGLNRRETLVRLGIAGFIEVSHPSPGVVMLNLDSWFEHLAKTQEDPDFWEEGGENWRAYMLRNGLRLE